MKINKFNISLILLASILMIGCISAGVMVIPADSATISGTAILNASFAGGNMSNCTFYVGSSLTANISWTQIGPVFNSTVDTNLSVNGTFDSTDIEDSNDYVFNATCVLTNKSVVDSTTTSSSVIVNNTVPDASTSLTPTSDTDGIVIFSGSVNGVETTSCTLRFVGINPGSEFYNMVHSGDTCTYTTPSAIPDQTYRWFIRTSDESDTVDSSQQSTNVDVTTSAGKAVLLASQTGVTSKGGALLSITNFTNGIPGGMTTFIIAIIIVVAIVIARRK